jgi:predicted aminopeptidase
MASDYDVESKKLTRDIVKWSTLGGIFLVFICLFAMWGCPQYRVYQQGMEGEAELGRAQQNRQIVIQEAQAKKEAAKMLAEAEVIRARGVDSVNRIIGQGLQGNESYLQYLWLQEIGNSNGDVIYIPTEANMPILEAGRRARPKVKDSIK